MKKVLFLSLLLFVLGCKEVEVPEEVNLAMDRINEEVDYNIHVKKILSDKCFSCHGNDAKKQKADLRLDIAEAAYSKKTESGMMAIVPGDISSSDFVHRILSEDPDYLMPEPSSHLTLSTYEKAVLVKWIKQGAKYKPHWAYVAPKKTTAPKTKNTSWVKNDIDKFILSKIEAAQLNPSPRADKETLIRRLSFDIRGFAPSIAEVDAFLKDPSANAYEKLVDRFLASPDYGERMAIYWLDLARFADSFGYLDDKHYVMSPWRDWVIEAYNKNLSFKDFITWQLAGDLLPNTSKEKILATGFNRNHKQNTEAGIIEEEFRVENVVDRTSTLGTGLMAMSVGCAKCHDHKFDPISQKDFYSLYAFFNSTFENGSPNYGNEDMVAGPTLLLPTKVNEQKISQLKSYIANLEKQQNNNKLEVKSPNQKELALGLSNKLVAKLNFDKLITKGPKKTIYINELDNSLSALAKKVETSTGVSGLSLKYNDETQVSLPPYKVGYFERYEPFSFSIWLKVPNNYPLATVFHNTDVERYGYQGYDLILKNNQLNFRISHAFPHDAISVMSKEKLQTNKWYHLVGTYDGSSKAKGVSLYLDGKKLDPIVEYDHLVKHIRSYPNIHKTSLYNGITFGVRILDRSMPGGEVDEFQLFNDQLSHAEASFLFKRLPFPIVKKLKKYPAPPLLLARKNLSMLLDSTKEVMVMGDLPKPRPTYVLKRGIYDSFGERVYPSTPAAILPFPKDLPKNRLGLADWLFLDQNPLTARVAVNRIWQLLFGTGIVTSSDNFGSQGDIPSHPELLDHLAVWYREHKWNTKELFKYIYMSSTYQQSAEASSNSIKMDPTNVLLTRSPRYRYPAEMIRDNALKISELLTSKIGGPSVYPYQPTGLWDELTDKSWKYVYNTSTGDDTYRKSIYTIRKRTSVVPFLQIFDAPDRSTCIVKRQVSSSPMQSLAMLNDPQIIEAARNLAWHSIRNGGNSIENQLNYCFRLVTGRKPQTKEIILLNKLYKAEKENFGKQPTKAARYLSIGNDKKPTSDKVALASFASVAATLMNTDEFFTRK
jgi:cytochrome c553